MTDEATQGYLRQLFNTAEPEALEHTPDPVPPTGDDDTLRDFTRALFTQND